MICRCITAISSDGTRAQSSRVTLRGGFHGPLPLTALPPKADVHPRSCYVAFVPIRDKVHRSETALFDHLIGESTRLLAPPLAHGTDDRIAPFRCGALCLLLARMRHSKIADGRPLSGEERSVAA